MKTRIAILALTTLLTTMIFAANRRTKLYVYGFATSFKDSTAYFTEIQELDSAWVDRKTGFLYSRDNYSYQLRDYLKKNGMNYPTCITMYAKDKKKIEKKYTKLRKMYTEKRNFEVKYVLLSDFRYRHISPDEDEIDNKKK